MVPETDDKPSRERTPAGIILIVDDDEPIRKLLSTVMSRGRYEVVTAANGNEAMAVLRSAVFDVIIMDLMMPILSGYDVIRRLRIDAPLVLDRVIVASAASTRDLESMSLTDVCAVLNKPFDISVLQKTVWECIQTNGRISGASDSML